MPLAIIGPILGGLVVSAIGGSQNAAAQDDAQRTRNAALGQFTNLQNDEFAKRNTALTDSAKRIGDIKDQSFASLLKLRGANADENAGIKTKYSDATTGAQLQTADIKDNTDAARNVLEDASDIRLNDVTSAERARQQGFQGQGTDIASRMIASMGRAPFDAAAGGAAAGRASLINQATAGDGTGATPVGVDPNSQYGKALSANTGSMVGLALGQAGGQARTSATMDAIRGQGRTQQGAATRVDILGRKAVDSRSALDPEMTSAKMIRDNADADANERKANAQSDLDGYVKILQDEQAAEEKRTGTRQGSYDQLIQDVANGSIQTEEDFINAINASSLNFEDAMRQLTNFKMGGTVGSSFMGNLLSQAGGSLISAGAGNIGK